MSEITTNYIEVLLPVLPLRGVVGFPAVQMNIDIARSSSLKAFTAAANGKATKIIIPSEIQGLAGLATSFKEVITDPEAPAVKKPVQK